MNLTRAVLPALLFLPLGLLSQSTHWGMSSSGGEYEIGTIWSMTEGGTFTKRHDFFRNLGANPKSDLVKFSTNGKLYGVTELGGANGDGSIFSYDPSTGVYTTVFEFSSATHGSRPIRGLTEAPNATGAAGQRLWGMCSQGGTGGFGTLFEFDPATNTISIKFSFTGTTGTKKGAAPKGRLFYRSTTGIFYGTCSSGGTASGVPALPKGVLFSYQRSNGNFIVLREFAVADGTNPEAGVMMPSSGTIMYGVTKAGGANSSGTLFSFNITGSVFAVLYNFGAAGTDGTAPIGELVQTTGGLIGTCSDGGSNGLGAIYRWVIGSPGTYAKLYDCASGTGWQPLGRLALASNSLLYGQFSRGGTNDAGVLFSFDPATSTCTPLVHMNSVAVSNGQGGLIEEPAGTLHGLTNSGGQGGNGALFKYVISGGAFTTLVHMGLAVGSTPKGRLTMAPNGNFYGLTTAGGVQGLGILFSFEPSTNTLTKIVDLTATTGSGPVGTMALTGGKLYGVCRTGGVNSGGTLFEFDPGTNTFTKKQDLSASTGTLPLAGLMLASNGKLYGTTTTAGTNGLGTVFEYVPSSNSLTVIRNLTASDGNGIEADFFQASNGLLYGVGTAGGTIGDGTLFRVDPSTNIFTKLYDFDGLQGGSQPAGELVQHANGMLYGTCRDGGTGVNGSIWSWNIGTSLFTEEYPFDVTDAQGKFPEGGLLIGSDGNLYGTCMEGGTNTYGTLFKFVPGGSFTVQRHLSLTDGRYPANGRVNDVVPTTPGIQLNAKVFLEGPYVQATNLMGDSLRVLGYVPLSEPYTALGFTQVGGGGETTTAPVLAVTGNNAIVDWIRLELRSSGDPTSVVATKQCLVQRDGDIVGTDGTSAVTFTLPAGNYHVAVRHRNHLSVMTSAAVALSSSPVSVDFTLPATTTYGTNARKALGTAMVLWAGNVFRDSPAPFVLKYTGSNNDRDPILSAIGGVVPTNTVTGYRVEDVNMDGVTKYTGLANDRDVILTNIGGVVPTNTRTDQLP